MTHRRKKKYRVIRAIEKGKDRHEPGEVITLNKRKWPVNAWIRSGVIMEVQHGDG